MSVRYERRGAAAWITLDRPQARNAMTFAMYEELVSLCGRVDDDEEVRALVLRGAGAGTDIGEFRAFSSGDDGVEYEATIDRIVGRLEAVRKPVLAFVEGHALGGGLTLAAACDLRVCTPDAKLGMPIARTLGNCLSIANYARLVALIGEARVRELIFTARLVDAEEAVAIGLATEIGDEARAQELAEQLAARAPITLRVTKEALRRLRTAALPDGDDLVREAYGSEDFRGAVEAFGAKRAPEWSGR
jgi:enoyl-CoA hydratase